MYKQKYLDFCYPTFQGRINNALIVNLKHMGDYPDYLITRFS